MTKSENTAKLSKGLKKKKAQKCKFIPKFSTLTCFLLRGYIGGHMLTWKVGVVRGFMLVHGLNCSNCRFLIRITIRVDFLPHE